jgi:hypothetical protein
MLMPVHRMTEDLKSTIQARFVSGLARIERHPCHGTANPNSYRSPGESCETAPQTSTLVRGFEHSRSRHEWDLRPHRSKQDPHPSGGVDRFQFANKSGERTRQDFDI